MAALNATALIHEYLIEEDEMGDSAAQSFLLDYLSAALKWLYRPQGWFIARKLTFYHSAIMNSQQMITPDLAVFNGIPLTTDEVWELLSWDMRPKNQAGILHAALPCPPVVFEPSNASTWRTDIENGHANKPWIYGAIGVREYFATDPNPRPVWRNQGGGRLRGWRYDATGQPIALTPDARGWLWSEELDSWLAPAGTLLRLYDAQGHVRLTETEAARQAYQEAVRALQEVPAQAERAQRARQEPEMVRQEAEAARRHVEERIAALKDVLKAHNIDPDQL